MHIKNAPKTKTNYFIFKDFLANLFFIVRSYNANVPSTYGRTEIVVHKTGKKHTASRSAYMVFHRGPTAETLDTHFIHP